MGTHVMKWIGKHDDLEEAIIENFLQKMADHPKLSIATHFTSLCNQFYDAEEDICPSFATMVKKASSMVQFESAMDKNKNKNNFISQSQPSNNVESPPVMALMST